MKVAIMVEGKTEKAFLPKLREFIEPRVVRMPRLDPVPFNGRIPKGDNLKKQVNALLSGKTPADHVVALTDVYTGGDDFRTAEEAKRKMREWAGDDDRFHPHVALHDFEAWLIPFWATITKLAKCRKRRPNTPPEMINHQKPPCSLINELYLTGERKTRYIKAVDGKRILEKADLAVAATECPELRKLINTILNLAGARNGQLL